MAEKSPGQLLVDTLGIPQLESICPDCKGSGYDNPRLYNDGSRHRCSECLGVGYMLTDDGRRLQGFLSRLAGHTDAEAVRGWQR